MRTAIIVTICVLLFLGGAFVIHRQLEQVELKAQSSRDLSKMMAVRHIAESALSAYYKQHGSYPDSLNKLPLQTLPWGDEGSSGRDLDSWIYRSNGEKFTMTWVGANKLNLFLGGKKGQRSYYSEWEMPDDKLK